MRQKWPLKFSNFLVSLQNDLFCLWNISKYIHYASLRVKNTCYIVMICPYFFFFFFLLLFLYSRVWDIFILHYFNYKTHLQLAVLEKLEVQTRVNFNKLYISHMCIIGWRWTPVETESSLKHRLNRVVGGLVSQFSEFKYCKIKWSCN